MKKILSLALILMLALASFTGAVAQEDRGEPNVTVDSVYYDDWSIEITWLPQDGFDTTDTAMADYLVGTAVAFVKDHPEVKVTCAAQSINIADAMSKLLTQAAAGNAPDVASVDSFYLPLYYDYLQPVTDVFEANGLSLDSWFPFAQDAMTNEDGDIVAMWYDTDVRALYYQKSVMPTPPATWDELIEYAQKLTTEDHYGYVFGAGDSGTMMFTFVPYIWCNGGDVMSADGTQSMLDQPEAVEALQLMCDLANEYKVCPEGITAYGWTESQDAFLSGKASMIVLGSAAVWSMLTGEYDINAGSCLIPSKDGVTYSSFSGGDSLAMVYDCANPDVAWDFIEYCLSEDVQVEEMAQYGQLPARSDLFDNQYFEANPEFQVMREALAVGEAPYSLKYNEMYVPFLDGVQAAINGVTTAEEAFASAAQNINALLAE